MVTNSPELLNSITSLDSWVYLSDWILAVVLGIGFVFYFSRLVGFLLSLVLKFTLWKHYKVHVSFDAFRISPLGGRITATNIVVSNSDFTLSILQLNLTWRYWLLHMIRVSEIFFKPDEISSESIGLTLDRNKNLETSIEAVIDGLEIFMYNRKFAYDNILNNLETLAKELDTERSDVSEKLSSLLDESLTGLKTKESQHKPESRNESNFLLRMLPIGVRIRKGAFVLGNHTTPHILVASYTSANALIDLAKSPCPQDKYRLKFETVMQKFQISMKPNITYNPERYTNPQSVPKGNKIPRRTDSQRPKPKNNFIRKGQKLLSRLLLREHKEAEQALLEWRGLRRYVGDFKGEPIIEIDSIEEYAKFSQLLESASTQLLYYFDAPGINPSTECPETQSTYPKFGVDITFTTPIINYGSWADRQRGPLQSMLFPQFARDSVATDFVNGPGDQRKYAGFNICIKVTDEFVIRVPTREFSKDRVELKAQAGVVGQKQSRHFGWIEVTSGNMSEISLFTSYLPTEHGYPNKLLVNLSDVEVRTSVTHDLLFCADTHVLDCDIGFPLKWNAQCIWNFNMTSTGGAIFFLGEHITFFADLISDFGSGLPANYESFRPFIYNLHWNIQDYRVFLNVNDGNVFDDPLDFEANSYLCFRGDSIDLDVTIPMKGSFAKYSKIEFLVITPNLNVFLDVPATHTVGSFMKGDKQMGATGPFEVSGYYKAYSNIEVNHNNLAFIEAKADEVSLLFYGYLARYFFSLRENYFGDLKAFQTVDEYLQSITRDDDVINSNMEKSEDPDYWSHYKTENDLNVIFSFLVREGLLIFPCLNYDFLHHIGVKFSSLDVDIHLTSYYMDLQVDFSPATGHYFAPGSFLNRSLVFDTQGYYTFISSRKQEIFIDKFSLHTHRMLGLDLNTYQCKWDFATGDILIEENPMCLTGLLAGLQAFALGFKDYENTHRYVVPIIYDAANFSFRCPRIEANLRTGFKNVYCKISAIDVLLSFNDIANFRYSDRITVLLPSLTFEMIDSSTSLQSLYLKTSLVFNNICQKATMLEHRHSQQTHVRRNDAPTHRAPFILFPENRDEIYNDASGSRYPSTSLPTASLPLNSDGFYSDDDTYLGTNLSDSSSAHSLNYDEYFEPTTNYIDEDFTPQRKPSPGEKFDGLIFEFAAVNGFLTAKGMQGLAELLMNTQILDLEFLIDRLQCQTVKSIIKLIRLVSVATNIRFVCPSIVIKFLDSEVYDADLTFTENPTNPVLTIAAINPSIVATDEVSSVRNDHNSIKIISLAFAIHVETVTVSLQKPEVSVSAFTVQFKEVESWLSKTEKYGLISSASCQEIEIDVQQTLIEWSFHFIQSIWSQLLPALTKLEAYETASNTWKKQLAYLLCPSAEVLELHLDPKVITKPSRLHRSVIDHVRFFDSWKIVSKFRSILDDVDLYENANQIFLTRNWDVPENGLDVVYSSFRSWRAWEGNMDQRRHFFETIFLKEVVKKFSSNIVLKIGSFGFSLLNMDDCKDFLSVRELSVGFKESKSTNRSKIDIEPSHPVDIVEGLINVKECEVSVSQGCFSVAETILTLLKDTNEGVTSPSQSSSKTQSKSNLSISFNIDSFIFHFILNQVHLDFHSYHTVCLMELLKDSFSKQLCLSLASGQTLISLGLHSSEFVTISPKQSTIILAASLGLSPYFVVDANGEEMNIELRQHDDLFKVYLKSLQEDVKLIQDFILKVSRQDPESKTSNSLSPASLSTAKYEDTETDSKFPEVSINISARRVSIFVDVLNPVKFHMVVRNGKFQSTIHHNSYEVNTGYLNLSIEMVIADIPLGRIESSRFGSLSHLAHVHDVWLLKTSLNLGYFKISIQLFFNALKALLKHKSTIVSGITDFNDIISKFSMAKNESVELEAKKSKLAPKFAFELQVDQEYCGFLIYKELCRFSAEIEGLSLSMSNFEKKSVNISMIVPINGEIMCSGARFSILDPLFAVGLSTVIDIKASAKLLNDTANVNYDSKSQGVQVVLDYSRICLSPPVLFKIFDFLESIKKLFPQLGSVSTSKPKRTASLEASLKLEEPSSSFVKMPSISSIHVLSYNLCIGWLFGGSHKDFPGFICGAERLFAITKSDIGKLTMVGGYFSVANGSTASSFFSASSELHGLNRAFMPKLQINYFVDDVRKLWINVKGDQLDARFMTNSKIAIERTLKSISEIQKYLENRVKTTQMREKLVAKTSTPSHRPNESTPSFKPNFLGVEVNIGFDGSKILLYRLQDNDFNEVPSSLTLHCPAVQTVILYQTRKDLSRKHLVKAEMLISQSDNTLYPSCVPVIRDFASAFKSLFQSTPHEKPITNRQVKTKSEKQDSGLGDFRKLMKDFEVSIGVRVDPQKVSLSCEPVAKVAAVVEFDGASIVVSTGLEDVIHALANAKGISASLQHIYSDERSGTIEVKNIMFSNVFSLKPPGENYSSISIEGIHGYVKMKQYQDVDLFSDIWFPSTGVSTEPPLEEKSLLSSGTINKGGFRLGDKSKTMSTLLMQLDCVVSDVSVEVDFGSALGTVKLGIDRTWIITQKRSALSYSVKFGMGTVAVDLSGRLSGYVKLKKLLLRSSIEWKLCDQQMDVPLIHMSGVFSQVSVKGIFDDHVFAIIGLTSWYFDVYNRKNGIDISKDHLLVRLNYESVDVSLTSLSASDFYDIYNTINRMIEENKTSYKEILKDSNEGVDPESTCTQTQSRKLETKIEVTTGLTRVQVFPHSFFDNRVFLIECDLSKANFVQNEYSLGVMNQIELQLNSVVSSFAVTPGTTEAIINEAEVEDFVKYVRQAKGGEIISLPKFMISMRTYQKFESNLIEYMFQSSFGGTVNVRWNLGSVNCVRDMYAAHKRALLSRMEASHLRLESTRSDLDRRHSSIQIESPESYPSFTELPNPGEVHKDFEQDIQDTLDKVTNKSKYTYKAIAPPIIEAPQLRELGNATPPLEWFGLHRSKFPNAVHQLAIVTLQKLMHEIEEQYSRTLGRAKADEISI